jgi:two-component system chemotaxis response regulator CheY
MRALIVEDDFTNRLLLQSLLSRYGECHVAVNGREALEAFRLAQSGGQCYDLVCMDIQMPEMDGLQAVHEIRQMEKAAGADGCYPARIIMTTASNDAASVSQSVEEHCDGYLLKPINASRLVHELQTLGLIPV